MKQTISKSSKKISGNVKKCREVNVVIGSVRAAHFTGSLDVAGSSFYDLYDKLASKWQDYPIQLDDNMCIILKFNYFNAVPSDQKPRADMKILEKADVFLILVENEFQYANGEINPMYRQYLDERLDKIRNVLKGKKVMILNSDIQHTPELILNYTLKGSAIKEWDWIGENDFKGNIHTLKYYNLSRLPSSQLNKKKTIDLAYWGSYRKDSPIRQQILTGLRKKYPNIKAYYLGHLPPFTDAKWTRKFIEAVPILSQARTTLCFSTENNSDWLTAKYHEAMGMKIIPLVWQDYDQKNQYLGILPWQRVYSLEELVNKIELVRNDKEWMNKWKAISTAYTKKILSEDELFSQWEQKVLPFLLST